MFRFFKKSKKERKAKQIGWWTSPDSDILPDPPTNASCLVGDISLEAMSELVSKFAPVEGISYTVGSSVITYNFRLIDLRHLNKAEKLPKFITAETGKKVIYSPNRAEGAHFSLVVTRSNRSTVHFKNSLCRKPFVNSLSPTSAMLGLDTCGNQVAVDIADMPHLLVAGTTGSGKSVLLHTIICSMLFKGSPSELQFIMVDVAKRGFEFGVYNGLPHLKCPVITDTQAAIDELASVCQLMEYRYEQMSKGVTFPKLVIVIDEFADLIMTSKAVVEDSIVRIAQAGRQSGIHLICATLYPVVKVVTGLIKNNMPSRIALTMKSHIGSSVIDVPNAHKLSSLGDAMYQPKDNTKDPIRFQAALVSEADISAICDHWINKAFSSTPAA